MYMYLGRYIPVHTYMYILGVPKGIINPRADFPKDLHSPHHGHHDARNEFRARYAFPTTLFLSPFQLDSFESLPLSCDEDQANEI